MKMMNSRTRFAMELHDPRRASGVRKVASTDEPQGEPVDAHVVRDPPVRNPRRPFHELHARNVLETANEEKRQPEAHGGEDQAENLLQGLRLAPGHRDGQRAHHGQENQERDQVLVQDTHDQRR